MLVRNFKWDLAVPLHTTSLMDVTHPMEYTDCTALFTTDKAVSCPTIKLAPAHYVHSMQKWTSPKCSDKLRRVGRFHEMLHQGQTDSTKWRAYLDIQILSWLEVHDVDIEVIVCSLRQQLSEGKDFWADVYDRLLACGANNNFWLTTLYKTTALSGEMRSS